MLKLLIAVILILVMLLLIKRREMSWRQSFMKTFYPVIMLKGKLLGEDRLLADSSGHTPPVSFYGLKSMANDGKEMAFAGFRGKKILIVNTASDCGYTGQYTELETLHRQYPQLVILGFPANDFKQQEQGNDATIAAFCQRNYGVSFQLMQKSSVIKSDTQNPVFRWLSDPGMNGWCQQDPVWNFCKYLVNEEGQLMAFFPQTLSPLDKRVLKKLNE